MTGNKRSTINQGIGQAADLSQAELVASWRTMFMSPRSKGFKRVLHERASAFRIRTRNLGSLRSPARRRLLAIADSGDIAKPIPPAHHDVPRAGQEDSQRHSRTAACCP